MTNIRFSVDPSLAARKNKRYMAARKGMERNLWWEKTKYFLCQKSLVDKNSLKIHSDD